MKKLLLSVILMLGLHCMSQNIVPEGAINGLFSVGQNKKVYFSKGNLQYQASTRTWRFAENQWVCKAESNNNISETYNGWIDLFGWGTSGYNHGATCYQPWSTDNIYGRYWAYGQPDYNLYDQTGKADWGYNAISNGGNQNNLWRTLTFEEWDYIMNKRQTNSGFRFAKATVNSVEGIIFFPDDWVVETFPIESVNSQGYTFRINTISAADWITLESHGAVFFPITGNRDGNSYSKYNGSYWTSSVPSGNIGSAFKFSINVNNTNFIKTYRNYGCAVRLVQDYLAK